MIRATTTLLSPADRLAVLLDAEHIPYQREFRFHERRRWKSDFFLPGPPKILIEVEGGAWLSGGGRHNRGPGFEADCEKYAEALVLGYVVLRVTPRQIDVGLAMYWVQKILKLTRLCPRPREQV
jgi:hypothetical protein